MKIYGFFIAIIILVCGNITPALSENNYELETTVGDYLAIEGFKRYGKPIDNDEIQKYVNLITGALARNVNMGNDPLYAVVIDSPVYASFSLPGGIIMITTGFIGLMTDESELAGIIAHEIAHISFKHVLKIKPKTEKELSFDNLIRGVADILFNKGIPREMELEADKLAVEIVYRTGYSTDGLLRMLKGLKEAEATAHKKNSWYQTHPAIDLRIETCLTSIKKHPEAVLMATVRDRFIKYKYQLLKMDYE